ncbi:putative protein-arginine deiminase [Cordyceps militaris CM01]|uniref:Protein-arginine deiminase C-terminal domain-containing protein n=1 Tax=Cordyceps militaris (strain CM01) TaxID=983644 RepID=G3JIM7_CORMM|nr:putative protein-arginine deiminase [Cordyceps militaris CM01]EGX91924.1 putative protein-arginine deiminase [Cordyceps militaris CM01]
MKSIPIVLTGLAALAAAESTSHKRATGTTPSKEELCKETEKCIEEIKDKGQDFSWDLVAKCLAVRRPPPTKEELCVGFKDDFEACQRETGVCFNKISAEEDFTWEKVSKCLEGRLPSASGSAAPPAAPTSTKPEDKPVAPPANTPTAPQDKGATDAGTAFKADLRVDTNRDGVVDVDDTSDQAGKDTWTDAAGAIFLPNIADSGDRCKKLHTNFALPRQLATLYDTLGKCHDAADDEQRAPQNLAPMRTMPIQGLSDAATGTISIAEEKSRALVRVFREAKGGKWEIVNNDTIFTAQDLKEGLTLGVDARDTRRPDWDGRVSIAFTVRDGQAESTDTAMLRVAPVLLHHHRQAVTEVFTSDFPQFTGQVKDYLNTIIAGIQTSMKTAGITGPLTRLATNDVWAQDYFEPGYTSMPGPNGTAVALRVVIEGRHDQKHNATSVIYTTLRGDGVGAVAQKLPRQADLSKRSSDFDAGGNLESLPPYELNGHKYPAGRILVGGDSDNLPVGMDFFAAQEIQAPLVLDSTWLSVKHVDEMVQAVPAKTPRGWALLVVDAEMGLQMLRDASAAGFGSQRVISRSPRTGPTIAQFLNTKSNTVAAEVAAKAMAANIEILKKETGLTDAEIHRVPALISLLKLSQDYVKPSKRRRGLSSRDDAAEAALDAEFLDKFPSHLPDEDETEADETPTEQRRQAAAPKPPRYNSVLPSLVNGVPLSDSHYLAPKPFGTVIDGKDIFEEAAAAAYKKAGFTTIEFMEEWRIHSVAGDLHCLSNTFRETSEQWW